MESDLEVLADDKFNVTQQCRGSQKGHFCPGGNRGSITSQAREGIVLLCSVLGRPQMLGEF